MKKLLFGTILLVLAIVVPIPTMAGVSINIGIPFPPPPPIPFAAPPQVIVMPETSGVYVAPDIDADLYFWNGFWWRLWEGRWYRSAYYDRDWAYYNNVPSFYFDIDPHWRDYYRNHNWYGHQWNYQRIPYERLQKNWKTWQTSKSWGGQKTWGVQGYPPRTQSHTQVLRQQRQQQYQQRPEVQKHQEYMRQQKQPQRSQGKPERGEEEHRK
ncbi:MAG TPA: hypothetical protein VEK32_03280 [Thermodesulfobacteriota bacterium]|nr:hypothetical protein [Thermodesulfobacteriota bacterium]